MAAPSLRMLSTHANVTEQMSPEWADTVQAKIDELEELRKENIALKKQVEVLKDGQFCIREGFTPNCPIHRSIRLPDIVKKFVDTRLFQRLRNIKQLALCYLVYPGAVHDRFFHSIGTAWLAYSFMKEINVRQPELSITRTDILCVTLAGLLHDLGHPCFSHTFEAFMHLCGDKNWRHEDASITLCDVLFKELKKPLEDEGFTEKDLIFIKELINPPTTELRKAFHDKDTCLAKIWDTLIKGRPVECAWMFEIVSNWRSGIDVDKFDYFRRDAHYLGIHREFEHKRYFDNAKVMCDDKHGGITTISPSDKDKDCLQENMFETRKELHRCAYQHKTVKKLEMHMLDILQALNDEMERNGEKSLFQRATNIAEDPEAYAVLIDSYIHTKIHEASPTIQEAYGKYMVRRELMRMVAICEVIPDEEVPESTLNADTIREEVVAIYNSLKDTVFKDKYSLTNKKYEDVVVTKESLRCEVAKYHYGMKDVDPLACVLFHNKDNSCDFLQNAGRPLQQKLFLFWCPPADWTKDDDQSQMVRRLNYAFQKWFENTSDSTEKLTQQTIGEKMPKKKRKLQIHGSCPVSMDLSSPPASPSASLTSPASQASLTEQMPSSPRDRPSTQRSRYNRSPLLRQCQAGRSLKRSSPDSLDFSTNAE
eukprot:GEMP01007701.1.p1 GENE.GEMP01007701.1~~GEMP01007701.1.p1  ORF type:complete len:651 (+),score=118.01 GEMP01007701.1:45-1997(+)